MIVTTTVASARNATIPANSAMIENIPIAAGPIKNSGTGAPLFHLPGSAAPIGNERIIAAASEIDVYGSKPMSGIRIRFSGAPSVQAVSSGPTLASSLQIDRLQIMLPIAAPGGFSSVSYCIQRLADNPQKCQF